MGPSQPTQHPALALRTVHFSPYMLWIPAKKARSKIKSLWVAA